MTDLALPCFLDFEASKYDGFPIEVAWSLPDGSVTCHFINPKGVAGWTDDRWDDYAEQAIHHISRDMLSKEGRPPAEVAEAMNAALEGETVYCDGGPWDQAWLEDLFEAADLKPLFVLGDAEAMIFGKAPKVIEDFEITGLDAVVGPWKEAARAAVKGQQHRADNDVRYLQRLYLDVVSREFHLEFEEEMLARFPTLYRGAEFHGFGLLQGFLVGSGWYDIVRDLSAALVAEAEAAGIPEDSEDYPRASLVMRKHAELRWDGYHLTDAMLKLIDAATVKSRSTCETCGKPGEIHKTTRGYFSVACAEHIRAEGDT